MTHSIVVLAAGATGGDLSALASSVLALLCKIGSLLLVVFIGYKGAGAYRAGSVRQGDRADRDRADPGFVPV